MPPNFSLLQHVLLLSLAFSLETLLLLPYRTLGIDSLRNMHCKVNAYGVSALFRSSPAVQLHKPSFLLVHSPTAS